MNIIDLDSKYIKSYASADRLKAAMEKIGADKVRHVLCKTPSGRHTVILVGFHKNLLNCGFAMVS